MAVLIIVFPPRVAWHLSIDTIQGSAYFPDQSLTLRTFSWSERKLLWPCGIIFVYVQPHCILTYSMWLAQYQMTLRRTSLAVPGLHP